MTPWTKAADLDTVDVLRALETCQAVNGGHAVDRHALGIVLVTGAGAHLADVDPHPVHKVVLAKVRKLIRRGLLTGCPCGCRGDLELADMRGPS